jgi:carboxylesterase type B
MHWILLLLLLLQAAAEPVVDIPGLGTVHGVVQDSGLVDDRGDPIRIAAFLGIPFAKSRRWQVASPVTALDSPFNASVFGPGCPVANGVGLVPPDGDEVEECLTLNVFCRASVDESTCASSGGPRPVLFHLHGGAFILGSAKHPYAAPDPSRLVAATGAVYVKSQYRLGVLGFMGHPAMPREHLGQFGLQDQLMAMRWTKQHAAAFGGDPSAITASGGSAGAISLCFHITNPASKGLFRTAILQSPQCAYPFPGLDESFERSRRLARSVGCALGGARSEEIQRVVSSKAEELGVDPTVVTPELLEAVLPALAPSKDSSVPDHPLVTPTPPPSVPSPGDSVWFWLQNLLSGRSHPIGALSLAMGGSWTSIALSNGTVEPLAPAPASPLQLAAELVCMHGIDGQQVTDALPARRATFWFEGDMFFPVVNGFDTRDHPGLLLATQGLSDPDVVIVAGVQRSEGTLFSTLAYPVYASQGMILTHLASAYGEEQAKRLWATYFPPSDVELLLEGPGGMEAPEGGPSSVVELIDEEVDAAVDWTTMRHHESSTPHHGGGPTKLSLPLRLLSEALGVREWTSIAHLLSDMWRCGFLVSIRRIASVSAASSLPGFSEVDPASGEASLSQSLPGFSEVDPASGEASLSQSLPGFSGVDPASGEASLSQSPPVLRSKVYVYHMLHTPSSIRWPMHRLGAYHGSEMTIFYNASNAHPADRSVSAHMLPLLNRTLWTGTPELEGACDEFGRPSSHLETDDGAWCPVMVPYQSAVSAQSVLQARSGAAVEDHFPVSAFHIANASSSLGMAAFLHEKRGGQWVCEEVMLPIFDLLTASAPVPGQVYEPLTSRFINVVLPRSLNSVVRRPTLRMAVAGVLAAFFLALAWTCYLRPAFRRNCCPNCLCCCFCCGGCCGKCFYRPIA